MITPVNVQLVGLDKVGRTTTINNVSVALGVFLGASISGKTISFFFSTEGYQTFREMCSFTLQCKLEICQYTYFLKFAIWCRSML